MASKKNPSSVTRTYQASKKINRKGVYAKTKMSKNKRSKKYVKPYNSQGR